MVSVVTCPNIYMGFVLVHFHKYQLLKCKHGLYQKLPLNIFMVNCSTIEYVHAFKKLPKYLGYANVYKALRGLCRYFLLWGNPVILQRHVKGTAIAPDAFYHLFSRRRRTKI